MPNLLISKFFQKIYFLMFLGLALSGIIALIVANTPALYKLIFSNMLIFWALIILELALVVAISGIIKNISSKTATALFLFYSAINGLTLAVIFLVYTSSSIALTFFIASSMFAIMALFGFFTDKDLSSLGPILFMALIGILIALVINIFLKSSQFDFILSILGVILFAGLTAYDNFKFKKIASQSNPRTLSKYATIAALQLYLDFINMFLFLLRLLGQRKN